MRRTASATAALLLALLGLATSASAGSDVQRERTVIELAGEIEGACSEDILLTEGRVIETIQVFDDPNGRTHFLWHFRTEGLVGVGLDSGATYRDRSHGTQTGIASIPEGFATGSFTVHVRIESDEPAVEDLLVRWTFHLVKRDGENRVFLDRFTMECD